MSKDQELTDIQIVEIVDNLFKEIDDLKIKINKLDNFLKKNQNLFLIIIMLFFILNIISCKVTE